MLLMPSMFVLFLVKVTLFTLNIVFSESTSKFKVVNTKTVREIIPSEHGSYCQTINFFR